MNRKTLLILIAILAVAAVVAVVVALVVQDGRHDDLVRGPGGMMPGFGHDGPGGSAVLPWVLLAALLGLGGGMLIGQPWRAEAVAGEPVAQKEQFEAWHREAHSSPVAVPEESAEPDESPTADLRGDEPESPPTGGGTAAEPGASPQEKA